MTPVDTLWTRRLRFFWREAFQYWTYVGRSGFFTFLFVLFIVGSYAYIKTLQTLPVSFPYAWITTPIMLFALASSPIRTFVKTADSVFLLPAETEMDKYFRKALIYSFFVQAMIVIASCMILWPLYVHCFGEQTNSFFLFIALLLLAKWGNLLASWQETRIVYPSQRLQSQVVRWTFNGIGLYVLFTKGVFQASLLMIITVLAMVILLKRLVKYTINWDFLIQTEQKHLSAHYLFFSWFIDVPQRPTRFKERRFWSQMTKSFAFTQRNTFLYLYTKTFLRGELFGIVLRVTLIGMILVAIIPNDGVKAALLGIIILITSVQMSALEQQHRYTFWVQLYPLRSEWRTTALTRILFTSFVVQCLLLTIVFVFMCSSLWFPLVSCCMGIALGSLYYYVAYPRKLRRKLLQSQ
ncbi:MAG: ecsB [Bacilli bacterium]|nr:ecsB [Bacilli bacterium]